MATRQAMALLRKLAAKLYAIVAGIEDGIGGMLQYQWGQSNLTAKSGTPISPNTTDTSVISPNGNSQSPHQNETGVSPDDGYAISGVGQDSIQSVGFCNVPIYDESANILFTQQVLKTASQNSETIVS